MSSTAPTPKWKIALIPVLLLIFAGIVWKNVSSSTDSEVPELLVPVNFQKAGSENAWKFGRNDIAIAFNPFRDLKPLHPEIASAVSQGNAIPNSNRNELSTNSSVEASDTPAPLQALSSQPVTLLIKKGKKDIAVIGDQIIHSGQRLESGHEVRSIEIDRILLSNPNDPGGETLISPPKSRLTTGN